MSGFTYSILFKLTGSNALTTAANLTDRLDNSVNRVNRDIDKIGGTMDRTGRRGRSAFDGMRSSVMGWVTAIGLGAATLSSLNTAAQAQGIETAINFASGGAKEGAINMAFLREESDRLGLSLHSSQLGFKTLSGAMRGVDPVAVRKIFTGISTGSAAMNLAAEDSNGVLLAVGQIASKGKVMAEELRGQIGERIPGAFGIAARAMGVTESALDKMMERGELIANEFLPRFAAQMEKEMGGAAVIASQNAQAHFNRFTTAVYDLKVAFGEELLPIVTSFLQKYIIPGIKWISEHASQILFLVSTIGGLTMAVKLLTIAQSLFNVVLINNPIGYVVMAIGALVGAIVYAWNKFEGFRGIVMSFWEVFKEFGSILKQYVIQPLLGMGKTLFGVLTFDKELISKGIADTMTALTQESESLAVRIGRAAVNGYNKGVASGSGNSAGLLSGMAGNSLGALGSAFGGAGTGGGKGGNGGGSGLNIQSGIRGITSGGSKNITINVNKLVEGITINSSVKESVQDIKETVERALLQSLNSANQAQG